MEDEERTRLKAFLYLLGRDYLPLGTIEKLVKDVETAWPNRPLIFSNKGLEAHAWETAERILREVKP